MRELQVDLQIAQAERDLLAKKRAYYVPDVSLVGEAGTDCLRGGAGASLSGTGLDREQWSLGIQAAIPIFEGRLRRDEKRILPQKAVLLSSRQRLPPILLTTATTVGGMLPLWLGGGPMWEPMAVAIIFGLLFSTLLTLVVVPLLYSVFFSVNFRSFQLDK